jgi:hypothetical protein
MPDARVCIVSLCHAEYSDWRVRKPVPMSKLQCVNDVTFTLNYVTLPLNGGSTFVPVISNTND